MLKQIVITIFLPTWCPMIHCLEKLVFFSLKIISCIRKVDYNNYMLAYVILGLFFLPYLPPDFALEFSVHNFKSNFSPKSLNMRIIFTSYTVIFSRVDTVVINHSLEFPEISFPPPLIYSNNSNYWQSQVFNNKVWLHYL